MDDNEEKYIAQTLIEHLGLLFKNALPVNTKNPTQIFEIFDRENFKTKLIILLAMARKSIELFKNKLLQASHEKFDFSINVAQNRMQCISYLMNIFNISKNDYENAKYIMDKLDSAISFDEFGGFQ
jgi:hypothetical protein